MEGITKIVNLTPHPINLVNEADGTVKTITPSGTIARCAMLENPFGKLDGITLQRIMPGPVEGLPAPAGNTIYLVSAIVLSAISGSGRTDVFKPDGFVRDAQGNITGCTKLSCM